MQAAFWLPWDKASFAKARQEGKPILVNVAARWCHWCHVMDDETFADADVAAQLATDFIAIRVDADARPDIAERYSDWGWPATAVLTSDAEPVLELRGYQEKGSFHAMLSEMATANREGRLAARDFPGAVSIPSPRPGSSVEQITALRDEVQHRLGTFYDRPLGGWGRFQKYPFSAPIEQMFWRSLREPDRPWRGRAFDSLDGTARLMDPVDGGVYQYSVHDSWDEPHFERLASIQAGALETLTLAWQATRNMANLLRARRVLGFILDDLQMPDGGFHTSQDADAINRRGHRIDGHRYHARGRLGRRWLGRPVRDPTLHADTVGLVAHALLMHHAATGDDQALAAAQRALRRVAASHARGPAFAHTANDGPEAVLHLRDNAALGRALLRLHEATGDPKALEQATGVAGWLVATLQSSAGPFYAGTPDPAAVGSLAQRRLPLEDNGLAIRFLAELSWRGNPAWHAAAAAAALGLSDPETIRSEGRIIGQFLMGLETLLAEPVKVVLAGETPAGPFHVAALRLAQPMKCISFEADDYPMDIRPAAYVCHGTACSPPVVLPAGIEGAVKRLAGAGLRPAPQ